MALSVEDERAVERLSFYMLQEAYGAVCGLLRKVDPDTSRCMFEAVERSLESALQSIHSRQAEGENSTAIATAIAETLVPVFDEAHAAVLDAAHPAKPRCDGRKASSLVRATTLATTRQVMAAAA